MHQHQSAILVTSKRGLKKKTGLVYRTILPPYRARNSHRCHVAEGGGVLVGAPSRDSSKQAGKLAGVLSRVLRGVLLVVDGGVELSAG